MQKLAPLRSTDPVVLDEPLVFRDVAPLIPRRRAGRACALQTLYRWSTDGLRGVRLQYLQCGSTRTTTRRWLLEFFAELGKRPAPPTPRSRAARTAREAREAVAIGA